MPMFARFAVLTGKAEYGTSWEHKTILLSWPPDHEWLWHHRDSSLNVFSCTTWKPEQLFLTLHKNKAKFSWELNRDLISDLGISISLQRSITAELKRDSPCTHKSEIHLPQGFLAFYFISCVELRAAGRVCTASVYLALWSHIISIAGVEWMLLSLRLRLPEASLRAQEPGGTSSGCLVHVCEWKEEWKWRKPYCLLCLLEYRPAMTQLSASHCHGFYHFPPVICIVFQTFKATCSGLAASHSMSTDTTEQRAEPQWL